MFYVKDLYAKYTKNKDVTSIVAKLCKQTSYMPYILHFQPYLNLR